MPSPLSNILLTVHRDRMYLKHSPADDAVQLHAADVIIWPQTEPLVP